MSSPSHPKAAKCGMRAFTLIETVIAIGIVAFACIPICGLLPVGLSSYRSAVDRTTGTRIAQQIAGELATSSASLPAQQERYFDLMAQETAGPSSPDTIYYANVVASPAASLSGDSATDKRELTRINVEVCYNPGHLALSRDADGRVVKQGGQQVREYSFHVSR